MRRKIIKQGVGGNTIFLPIKWVRENNLKAGDDIEVYENEKDLIISGKGKSTKTKEIKFTDKVNKAHLRSIIASTYKAGYTEINLLFKQSPPVQDLNNIVNTFTGLEIISSNNHTVIIHSFLSEGKELIDSLIVKMFQNINQLAKQIDKEWADINLKEINSIVKVTVLKLRDHCLRSIHSTKYGGDYSYDYYDLVTMIEKLGGELLYLSRYISNNNPTNKGLIKDILNLLNLLYNAYLKKNYDYSTRLWNEIRKINPLFNETNLPSFFKKHDSGLLTHYYHLLQLIKQTASRLLSLSS
jgi:hypothetical protein